MLDASRTDVQERLAHQLHTIAHSLHEQEGVDSTLHAVAAIAVHAIQGTEDVGITQTRPQHRDQHLDLVYATSQRASDLDAAQYEAGHGPCLDAAYRHITTCLSEGHLEGRWSSFAPQARQMGVRSVLCLPLRFGEHDLGSLNLYSGRRAAFGDDAKDVGWLFAAHAAIAVRQAKESEQLYGALASRDVIGQAKGILMQRFKITSDEAFDVLKRSASQTHTKLRDVASQLALSGALPDLKTVSPR